MIELWMQKYKKKQANRPGLYVFDKGIIIPKVFCFYRPPI